MAKIAITVISLICIATLLIISRAQEADIDKYSAFHEQCSKWGYSWTAYTVVTEDEWELTLFRLTDSNSEIGELLDDVVVEIDDEEVVKIPILFQHGEYQDAENTLR